MLIFFKNLFSSDHNYKVNKKAPTDTVDLAKIVITHV